MGVHFPPELQLDDILLKIRNAQSNKNVGRVPQITLKKGTRAYRTATAFEILDQDGNHHHWTLTLHCIERTKKGWTFDHKRHVTIEKEELPVLSKFLHAVTSDSLPSEDGEYRMLDESTYESLKDLQSCIKGADADSRQRLFKTFIESLDAGDASISQLEAAFAGGEVDVLRAIAVSAKLVEYRAVVARLESLIKANDQPEQTYQELLEGNAWLFGSEYSELLERRKWTRDDNLDFMLRRTSDGYLEIVEIKTPIEQSLFNKDKSHQSYFPAASLAKVLGQVIRYIDEVDRQREPIAARDADDPLKIRARIIIGRDGDKKQQEALRMLNAHLHRIEVLTFDQLVKIGRRVLDIFEQQKTVDAAAVTADSASTTVDIPF